MFKKNKRLFWTITIWLVWVFLMSWWAIFSGIPQPFWPVVYNLVSLVGVFYAIRWIATQYWDSIHHETQIWVTPEGVMAKYPNAAYYLLRWQVAGVIGVILGYIAVSWYMEGLFVKLDLQRGRQPNFYYYTYTRWMTEALCVCGGNVMAAIEYHFKKERKKEEVLFEGYKQQYQKANGYDIYAKEVVDKYLARAADYQEPEICRCCGRRL